jgi:alginate O-acetyltransferase complex protein AlgI
LAYTLQLYFDFSGYCDMAVGAALLFGIRLPLNFASPYKAASIIEFWRRWHMTLSRFLRDYPYIPLGGSRRGEVRRYVNLLLTMLLGGIWHGAGWTFVAWGALHGAYLIGNHVWRAVLGDGHHGSPARRYASHAVTFVAVVFGWVVFRAENIASAGHMIKAMVGLSAPLLPTTDMAMQNLASAALLIPPLLGLVFLAPNTQELTGYERRGKASGMFAGALSPRWGLALGGVFALAFLSLSKVSEFLYFQF